MNRELISPDERLIRAKLEQERARSRREQRVLTMVLEHGKLYRGIERPKGYRHRRNPFECFRNAYRLMLDHRGTYIEGYVLRDRMLLRRHAWITLDDAQAIDVTWPDAEDHLYFGIAVPGQLAVQAMRQVRAFVPILEMIEADGHTNQLQLRAAGAEIVSLSDWRSRRRTAETLLT